ncbi:hypothetical protein [Allopusillimonas ginsengisoli]|uniref:hypothetical protein n=1 Tax=Allopusillimonas ginsengisoli TaxID=453575 RepID=UPI00102062B8|nr:hypothetical protein [Allopusillimonas ginsengisoli]TEA71879.1 hypothetical protein ERE07_20275 [Allopusillimonas ginsengisoli]
MENAKICGYFLLFSAAIAGASSCLAADFSKVYATEGYFEYKKDGAATLGLITSPVKEGKVKFTTCSNKTVEVVRTDLRSSTAKCDFRSPDDGLWPVKLDSVYKVKSDATNTEVLIQGKVVDLKKIDGWPTAGIPVRNGPPGEPVGYVFTDLDGSKAIAILKEEPPKTNGTSQKEEATIRRRDTTDKERSKGG